jgi:hypothetical protein
MRKFVAISMIVAAAGLAGCGKSGTKVYSNGKESVAVSQSSDHMTMNGPNGEKVEIGGNQDVSGKLPAYLPMYPGGRVKSSVFGNGKDGNGGMVAFHTNAAAADVIAFYKSKATVAGMADAMDMNSGGTLLYAGNNQKTNESVQVAATKSSDGTDVQLTWSSKK